MTERIMELRERRRITLTIWLEDERVFEPTTPTYELTRSREMIKTGTCEAAADGAKWQLTAEIQPDARGDYLLSYQFGLGTEIIRRSVPIKVI